MVAVENRPYSGFEKSGSSSVLSSELQISQPPEKLRVRFEGHTLYAAGYPGYETGLFIRDLAKSARKFGSSVMMADTLKFAAEHQATSEDPITGAEDGKIIHEFNINLKNGVELEGRKGKNTQYNACDTNAEYLITHQEYVAVSGDRSLARLLSPSIKKATHMMQNHVTSTGLYVEDPRASGAESYALKVTYWKDSVIPQREGGEPAYPVIYPFAHIQNLAGIRSAANLMPQERGLHQVADSMAKALPYLFDHEKGSFYLAIDRLGSVRGVSSDNLHALSYLEPGDLPPDVLEKIIETSERLETKVGYVALDPEIADLLEDKYHTPVWTNEQAEIHEGAGKHLLWARAHRFRRLEEGLIHVMEVSTRVKRNYFDLNPESNPEVIFVNGSIIPAGNDPQLWAAASRHYFSIVA